MQTLLIVFWHLARFPFASTLDGDTVFDFCIAILSLALLIIASFPKIRARLHIPLSMLALGYVTWLIPMSTPFTGSPLGSIASTSRLLLADFPLFIILAGLTKDHQRLHEIVLIASVGSLMVFTTAFVLGFYII